MRNTLTTTAGSLGFTFPVWADMMVQGWQVTIAILGGLVLAATLYNKILEIRQRRRDLARSRLADRD
ncbi:MAG: hypothetical protein AAGF53_02375 [Pseudomonadota bacterium]